MTNPAEELRTERLVGLRNRLDEVDAQILLLAAKDVLTDEEEARWVELITERDVVKPEFEKAEAKAALAEEIRGKTYKELKGVPEFRSPIADVLGGDIRTVDTKVARDAALRVLESRDHSNPLTTAQTDQVEREIRKASDVGDLAKRIVVTENDDYRSAWHKLLVDPQGATFLTDGERVALQRFKEYQRSSVAGQSLTAGDGGYAVPVFIDPSVILTDQETDNPFLQICRIIDINTSAWKGVSSAGVSWSFDAEETEVSNDALTSIVQPTISAETARGFIPFTSEIGDDWPGFADEMARLLMAGYDELLVSKFTTGAGSTEPDGILTLCDASTGVEVVTTTDGQFGSEDVYKVWKSLPQKHRRNASWMMSVDINNKIRQLGSYNNSHAFTENLKAGAADVLFSKPVYENPYMPDYSSTTGAANFLIVGDFQKYAIVRRRGMSIELVPHLFDTTTNLPSGQRGWYAYARVGGGATDLGGFRLLQNA
jgi:HK97 family phage major capsid protein